MISPLIARLERTGKPARLTLITAASALAAGELPRLALWTPACLGTGVAAWFAWPAAHPDGLFGAALAGAALTAAGAIALFRAARLRAALGWRDAGAVACVALACALIGVAATERRAAAVDAPIWRGGDAPQRLTARAVAFETTRGGQPRLALDAIAIDGVDAAETPRRLRLTLSGAESAAAARALVGRRVAVTALLVAPPPPVEPGAADLRRRAYFEGVGAYGRATARVADLGPAPTFGPVDAFFRGVDRARADIAAAARAAAPGQTGEVMAALLVGDRTGVSAATNDALRATNLGHLLAISGLHMALVSLSLFSAVRFGLALLARPPLNVEPKKLAALGALAAATAYLLLSGAAVSAQRAYIMVGVLFFAALLDRPALSLRSVAAAAWAILLLSPEALLEPGFQLSFAATVGLIGGFESAKPWLARRAERRAARREAARPRLFGGVDVGGWALGLGLSSLVAGLATAPLSIFYFQRVVAYGLAANLLAGPAMGLLAMPAAVAALAAAPFGLEAAPLGVMALGVEWILGVARHIAAWPQAVWTLPAAAGGLGLFGLGALGIVVWRAPALKAACALVALAAILAPRLERRPDVLIAPGGGLIGVMTPDGRAFDRDRGQDFAAALWLERDADATPLSAARRRAAFARFAGGAAARAPNGWRVELTLAPALDARALGRGCRGLSVLVAPNADDPGIARPADCLLLDRAALADAYALWLEPDGRWRAASAAGPRRPWEAAGG